MHKQWSAEEWKRLVLIRGDYTVSAQSLLAEAQALADVMQKTKGGDFGTPVLVDSLVQTLPLTKGENGEQAEPAKIYVVEFEGDGGYAFFGGDMRAAGLLGYVEEGDFDPNFNQPGWEYVQGSMLDYVQGEIAAMEALRGDSLYVAVVESLEGFVATKAKDPIVIDSGPYPPGHPLGPQNVDRVEHWDDFSYASTTVREPLLKTKWGQGYPYNGKTPNNWPTGCVTTAVAQIMNYYKRAASWNGHDYWWNEFQPSNQYVWSPRAEESIAWLFHDLGRDGNLRIVYGPNGSAGNIEHVPGTFINFGYQTVTTVMGYGLGHIIPVLLDDTPAPVYIEGEEDGRSGVRHAWVIDGLTYHYTYRTSTTRYWYKNQIVYTFIEGPIPYRTIDLVHCNWGWNGTADGWFRAGTFNPATSDRAFNFGKKIQMVIAFPNGFSFN